MDSCASLPVPQLTGSDKPSLFNELENGPFLSPPYVNSHDLQNGGYPGGDQGDIHRQMITSKGEILAMRAAATEDNGDSTVSSPASSTCNSPFAGRAEKAESFLHHSSLEESPASSPNSSYLGDGKVGHDVDSPNSKTFFSRTDSEDKSISDQEGGSQVSDTKVPKNIKLPQRKGGMQLWQFLYALLNDPEKKYSKLIEWTANSLSREFRLLEPEAIAIWWGEHKNKKNMSYDKLSRSLRYYYDKGIIRKISGERYVYQFCIDPELMYKHIGNSDSRPKLKPMPQSAHHATAEYQSQHGFTSCALLNKDPCFIAQGPLPIGMVHGQLLSAGSPFPPNPIYGGMTSFPHGYSDIVSDLHAPQLHNGNSFYPGGYDQMTPALPSMAASLGYSHLEPPSPMKMHFPMRKSHPYDMPGLAACAPKFENDGSYSQALLMPSSMAPHSTILSTHTSLSPPPLTSNATPSSSFTNQGSPLPTTYSNHSSPHVYGEDALAFEEFIPYSASEDYSLGSENVIYSAHNSSHAAPGTNLVENSWD